MAGIAVFNQKGGVAKTTTALNLTAALARAGQRPLAIDLDPQGHLSALSAASVVDSAFSIYAFYKDHKRLAELIQQIPERWAIIPAHLELAKVDTQFGKGPNILNRLRLGLLREQIAAEQRPIVIDCSPVLGVLSLSAIFAADRIVVPVSADYLAVKSALQVDKTLNALTPVLKQRIPRRYVLTRFDGRRRMSWHIDKTLRDNFGDDVCETRITENVSLAESPFAQMDVFQHAPASRGAKDYQALYEELQSMGFLPVPAKPAAPPSNDIAMALLAKMIKTKTATA